MALFRRRARVEKLREKGDLTGLGELLTRREIHVTPEGEVMDLAGAEKKEAAEALAAASGRRAVSLLSDGLSNPDPRVRASVLRALASMRMREARLALVEVAATRRDVTDVTDRSLALQELARGDGDVLEELVSHLVVRDDDLAIGSEHLAAVKALLDRETVDRGRISALLVDALGQADERIRQRAHRVLAVVGEAAMDPVIAALGPAESRKEAVTALGHLRNTAAVEVLVPLLEDESPQIRNATAWALGEIKDPRAVEPLAKATRDRDYDVRAAAMAALNGFGSVAIMIHLEARLDDFAARELQRNDRDEPRQLAERAAGGEKGATTLARAIQAALSRYTT